MVIYFLRNAFFFLRESKKNVINTFIIDYVIIRFLYYLQGGI